MENTLHSVVVVFDANVAGLGCIFEAAGYLLWLGNSRRDKDKSTTMCAVILSYVDNFMVNLRGQNWNTLQNSLERLSEQLKKLEI